MIIPYVLTTEHCTSSSIIEPPPNPSPQRNDTHTKQSIQLPNVDRSNVLYVSEMKGLIGNKKVERNNNVKLNCKKISAADSGNTFEFLPNAVESGVIETDPGLHDSSTSCSPS